MPSYAAFASAAAVHPRPPRTTLRATSPRPPSTLRRASRRHAPQMISFPKFRNPWRKDDDTPPPAFKFAVGYSYLAHPEKNTGEDAFFVEGNSAGVFDGVSGASETRGVDPRLYSQTLAALTRDKVRAVGADKVVRAAIEASVENEQIGASTACVVGMDQFGRLFGINLGDSGVRIVRAGKMIFRTKEQQHFFNCPYQLGTDSEDGLTMGQNVQQKLKEGDWVVLATDGLYDNVSDKDITAVTAEAEDPMELAEQLGTMASTNSVDPQFKSPFMMAALKAKVDWQGGKADDITIVTLRVEDNAELEPVVLLSTLPEAAEVAE